MRKADGADRELVIDILTSAYAKDTRANSISFVVKNDNKRIYRLSLLMGYLFDKVLMFGEVYISDNEKACVLIKYSDREKVSFKSFWLDLLLVCRVIGIRRILSVLKRQRLVNKYFPKVVHIRPSITAVLPSHKGGVTAAKLIIQVLKLNVGNKPVVLDTVDHYNVRLYKKFGFREVGVNDSLGFPIYFLRLN